MQGRDLTRLLTKATMAKKFETITLIKSDPLYEERSRLTKESLLLVYEYRFLCRQIALANGMKANAKSEGEKNKAVQISNNLRAKLAATKIKMARTDAALRKLPKVMVHVEEVFKFE